MVRANEGPTTILARRGYNSRVKERTRKTPSSRNSGIRSMPKTRLAALPFAGILFVVSGGLAAAAEQVSAEPAAEVLSAEAAAFFETKVRPLLVAKCHDCHAGDTTEGGLRLDSLPALVKGGDSGPAAIAGDTAASRLVAAVRRADGLAMPPDEPLTADEVATLEAWVARGLPWSGPGSGRGDDPLQTPQDMDSRIANARATHWSFQPLVRRDPPPPPDGVEASIANTWNSPIDRFILRDIATAGQQPSIPAAPETLVRRLWFDLTGLPPPADEVDAYCNNPSEDAYAALVDRLLTSREHAQHWARRWLDLARYADTMGYAFDGQESDYPFAWTYRDWVVAAFHNDLPYDRFVSLQLAADLIEPSVAPADLAALGFLTVGRTFLGNKHDIIDDRIDLVTRGLMGLTVACARCHDHKYEPVATADYYALHGIFASSKIPEDLPVIGDPPPGPEADAFAATMRELEQKIEDHTKAVYERATREAIAHAADYLMETSRPQPRGPDGRTPVLDDGYELQQLLIDRLTRTIEGAGSSHPILGLWAEVRSLGDETFAETLAARLTHWEEDPAAAANATIHSEMLSSRPDTPRGLAEAYARVVMRASEAAGGSDDTPDLEAIRHTLIVPGAPLVVLPEEAMRVARREERTELRKRNRDISRHQATAAGGPPRAMVLEDAAVHDSRILRRGNPGRPGDVVPRRVPTVLGGLQAAEGSSGRRELAAMITAPTNPLTPRLIVDWTWRHHFGRGLVETPGDLGLRGEPPAHAELLDDLAERFVTEGAWSLRWLHREMVMSRCWQQSSALRDDLREADPDNLLFARANRRRLSWEAWRDNLATAAGSLDLAGGGGRGMNPLSTDSLHVRSLYARLDRQDVPGMLRIFDIANPDTAVHARAQTTVPQQSLAVLNSPLVVESARRLAARAAGDDELDGTQDDTQFVHRLWRAALSRSPREDEVSAALAWLAAEAATDNPVTDEVASSDASAPETAVAESPPAEGTGPDFDRYDRLAQAVLATAEFQFVD